MWIAGVNEMYDKWYQDKDSKKKVAGCVRSYGTYKVTFDGHRIKRSEVKPTAESWLLMLLAGIAGEEVFAGHEAPRSIIDLSHEYRQWEGRTDSYGDFRQAQKWVKSGVGDGYFHAKEVWGVLQHYYKKAFYAVRDHKEFLCAVIPLLAKKGVMYDLEVMKLWNGFYQIEPTKKEAKKTRLDIKDNTNDKETTMRFTELETFILHDLSVRKVKGYTKDDMIQTYYGNYGVGGYKRFAYVEGRRYDLRGVSKKSYSIMYLLQRMGLLKVEDENLVAIVPDGTLPQPVSAEVWNKDLNTVIDGFKKSVDATADDPSKFLTTADIAHVVKNYPTTTDVTEAFTALETTVNELNELKRQESNARLAADILKRDVSSFKSDECNNNIRIRFLLELSAPALKAAGFRMKKDYPAKPANWDKMKKKEREACGWNEYEPKWLDEFVESAQAGTLVDDFIKLRTMSYRLTAESAHAAWRIEAARRHPDQGGSAEASAGFGAVWDKLEPTLEKKPQAAAA